MACISPKGRTNEMRRGVILMFGAFLLATSFAATAQDWPSRPIQAIVPFPPGSGSDIIARIVMEQVSLKLSQSITIDNRVGGGSAVGATAVAKADPDGYRILITTPAHTSALLVHKNLSYSATDLVGVAAFANIPQVVVIAPSKGIRTLRELAEAAKTRPMTYASGGTGSATHMSVEKWRSVAGFEGTHIPFRAGPAALFYFVPVSAALPFIQDGKVLPLAVTTKQRSIALPEVPTTIEAGFPGSDYDLWVGILAPAKTPRPIIDRLHRETAHVVTSPEAQVWSSRSPSLAESVVRSRLQLMSGHRVQLRQAKAKD
jgi:tripartite-type tricarboxylate transporter receptor subunit TctC